MLGENKNLKDLAQDALKDPEQKFLTSSGAGTLSIDVVLSYTKTNKLITALYMVTDIMEKDEPIRLKLRTLGAEILSDIVSFKKTNIKNLDEKINTVLSFLNITSDLAMVSEMNSKILIKEFNELKQSIKESVVKDSFWLEEFSSESNKINSSIGQFEFMNGGTKDSPFYKGQDFYKGQEGVRIGVQKGSTLLKALSTINSKPSRKILNDNFEALKGKRRQNIIKIIKEKNGAISIKDISTAIHNLGEMVGDKTLQRELVSMVKDGVLEKSGEKRWSQYFLK